jgi:hypothetical protein
LLNNLNVYGQKYYIEYVFHATSLDNGGQSSMGFPIETPGAPRNPLLRGKVTMATASSMVFKVPDLCSTFFFVFKFGPSANASCLLPSLSLAIAGSEVVSPRFYRHIW